jgi:hypothetical protein
MTKRKKVTKKTAVQEALANIDLAKMSYDLAEEMMKERGKRGIE